MFRGTHTVKLDSKGRLVIPGKYRTIIDQRNEGLVLTGHPDRYLLLMLNTDFEKLEEKVSEMPDNDSYALYYKQTLIGMADDTVAFDKAGRIGISADLRDHATFKDSVSVMGMRSHLRIWSKRKLESLKKQHANRMQELPSGWDGFRI